LIFINNVVDIYETSIETKMILMAIFFLIEYNHRFT